MPTSSKADRPAVRGFIGALTACTVLLIVAGCAASAGVPRPPHPSLIPALEARLQEEGGQPELLTRLGAAYREAGRMDDARRVLEQAHELAPSDPANTFFLGLTYEDLEQYGKARELYESFLSVSGPGPVRQSVQERLPLVRRRELEQWARNTAQHEAELADTPPQEGTIAVFPFRYTGQDQELAPLSRALSELLVTDLAQTDRLRVLERLRVHFLMDELALSGSGRVDPATAARSGRLLGAAHVVQGDLGGTADSVDLQSALLDVRTPTAEPVDQVQTGTPVDAIVGAEKQLALAIFSDLGIQLTVAERERVNERQTENVQALLAYGLGLEAEDRGDFQQASEEFSRASTLDPGFGLASEAAARVGGLRQAAATLTPALALTAAARFFSRPVLSDWRIRRLAFRDLEPLLPDVVIRDPAAEAFSTEGLEAPSATLRIHFLLP